MTPETTTIIVELPADHVDELTADGHAPQEAIHRAVRLWRAMDNPDETLAEADLAEAIDR